MTKDEQIDHILDQLAKKRSLSAICAEDEGMPLLTSFLAWVRKDASLEQRYRDAREAQLTSLLEETLAIAESATDDCYITTDASGKKVAKIKGRAFKRAQLMIETRERFAKLMLPDRFNTNRTDITSGGKALPAPVMQNDNRLNALLLLAAERAKALTMGAPMIDATPLALDDVMS
jgi:hypothetical protein